MLLTEKPESLVKRFMQFSNLKQASNVSGEKRARKRVKSMSKDFRKLSKMTKKVNKNDIER